MEQAADFYLRLHEEVNAPARRAHEAIRRLSGGLVASRTELARTERAIVSYGQKQQQAADAARRHLVAEQTAKLQGATSGIGVVELGAGLAVGAVAAIGLVAEKFGEATAEGLVFAQNMRLSFGFLTHDATLGAQTFEDVRREAQGLALDVHGTVDSFRQLLAAQFTIGQSHELVKMAADMQAVGASAEEVQRILYAVREVKDIGSLQQRQMRQLEMAGISGSFINKHLELRLGVSSEAQVAKMRKSGKIAADVAIGAIEDAVKETLGEHSLGDVAARMGQQTIAGMFRTAKGEVDNAFITLGERLEKPATALSARVFQTFQHIADSPAVQAFADKFVDSFTRAVDWVDDHWGAIDSAVMKTVSVLSGAFVTAIDFVQDHWGAISDALQGGAYIMLGLAAAAAVVSAPFIVMSGLALAAAAGIAYLTDKMIESRREIGEWLTIAGYAMAATGIMAPAGLGAIGAGKLISAGTGPTDSELASDIVAESKQRQLQNLGPQGQLGPLGAQIPEGAVKQIHVGDIHVPVQALDLDDPEGAGTKVASVIRRQLLNIIQDG